MPLPEVHAATNKGIGALVGMPRKGKETHMVDFPLVLPTMMSASAEAAWDFQIYVIWRDEWMLGESVCLPTCVCIYTGCEDGPGRNLLLYTNKAVRIADTGYFFPYFLLRYLTFDLKGQTLCSHTTIQAGRGVVILIPSVRRTDDVQRRTRQSRLQVR